jgi:thioredoxin-dependent peroxiredoxin
MFVELAPEMPAPKFSLPRDGGGIISLDEFAGRKLVLYFYPRADTPGCTLDRRRFLHCENPSKGLAQASSACLPIRSRPKMPSRRSTPWKSPWPPTKPTT